MAESRIAWLLALPAALAVAVSTACSAPGSSSSSTTSTEGPIKIAVVNAQSGQLSSLGQWEWKGAKLAADQWNAKGGINGRQIQLDVFDDAGDPTVGTNVARKIASEGYLAMIGTAESAVTVAMIPILQQSKIPNVTSGQSPAIVATKSRSRFSTVPPARPMTKRSRSTWLTKKD